MPIFAILLPPNDWGQMCSALMPCNQNKCPLTGHLNDLQRRNIFFLEAASPLVAMLFQGRLNVRPEWP